MKKKTTYNLLYLITILYLASGFINIIFALLGTVCMVIPFVLVYRDRKLTWCQSTCPRADLLKKVGNTKSNRRAPSWLLSKKAKQGMFTYFCLNMMFIILSTFMVSQGRIEAIDKVRFLMVFQIPWSLPQLWVIEGLSDVLIHLSYRLYSVMFSSSVLGITLALLYKPRTWCAVCPMNTMSMNYLKGLKKATA